MNLLELKVEYHKELNPKIWNKNQTLKPEVLIKLREIAAAFIKFLDVPNLPVDDIVILGSSANYNYTKESDLDLHLIMDVKKAKVQCQSFTEELFDAKNDVWKDRYAVKIYNIPVEVYMQDNGTDKERVNGVEKFITGVFSVKDNKWVLKPVHSPPDINNKAVTVKADAYRRKIARIIKDDLGHTVAKNLQKQMKKGRKAGLSAEGEFSVENLVYKSLRNSGDMEKLLDYIKTSYTEELSLTESQDPRFKDDPQAEIAHKFNIVDYEWDILFAKFNKLLNMLHAPTRNVDPDYDTISHLKQNEIFLPFNDVIVTITDQNKDIVRKLHKIDNRLGKLSDKYIELRNLSYKI